MTAVDFGKLQNFWQNSNWFEELNCARAWNVTQTQIRTLRCTNSDTCTQWHLAAQHSTAQQSMYTHMKYSTRLTTHGAKKEEENVEIKRERIKSIPKIHTTVAKLNRNERKPKRKNGKKLAKMNDFWKVQIVWFYNHQIDRYANYWFVSFLSLFICLWLLLLLCLCVCVFFRHNYAFKHLLNVLQFDKIEIYVK